MNTPIFDQLAAESFDPAGGFWPDYFVGWCLAEATARWIADAVIIRLASILGVAAPVSG